MRHLNRLLLLLLTIPLPAVASDAERLQALLADVSSLVSDFNQVTINADNRLLQENRGRLWVEGPSSFRIETHSPFSQTLVSNGTDFWTFDADLEQVIVRPLDDDLSEVPILLLGAGVGDITETYDVSRFEDEEGEHFVLSPRSQQAVFESLTLSFKATVPSAIRIRDSLGQRTRIDFETPEPNIDIAPARFVLEIPDGVDVIDDRIGTATAAG